jgi:DNA-binding MarR family transcriptional regulator
MPWPGDDGGRDSVTVSTASVVRSVEIDSRELLAVVTKATDQVDIDVSASGLRALLALQDVASTSLNDLADRLSLSQSAASRIVDKLVCAKLANRSAAADDRRRVSIRITPLGRRATAQLIDVRHDAFAAVFAQMSEADREYLARGLAAFAASARKTSD